MKRTELVFAVVLTVAGFAFAGFTPVYGQAAASGPQPSQKFRMRKRNSPRKSPPRPTPRENSRRLRT